MACEVGVVSTPTCGPFILFAILTVLGFMGLMSQYSSDDETKGASPSYIVGYVIGNLIIGYLIYYQCKNCNYGWAWFIFVVIWVVPFLIIMVLVVLLVMAVKGASEEQKRTHSTVTPL